MLLHISLNSHPVVSSFLEFAPAREVWIISFRLYVYFEFLHCASDPSAHLELFLAGEVEVDIKRPGLESIYTRQYPLSELADKPLPSKGEIRQRLRDADLGYTLPRSPCTQLRRIHYFHCNMRLCKSIISNFSQYSVQKCLPLTGTAHACVI